MTAEHQPVLERRHMEHLGRVPPTGDRRPHTLLQAPLPAPPRAAAPLPDPSDWTFDLVEQYHVHSAVVELLRLIRPDVASFIQVTRGNDGTTTPKHRYNNRNHHYQRMAQD